MAKYQKKVHKIADRLHSRETECGMLLKTFGERELKTNTLWQEVTCLRCDQKRVRPEELVLTTLGGVIFACTVCGNGEILRSI